MDAKTTSQQDRLAKAKAQQDKDAKLTTGQPAPAPKKDQKPAPSGDQKAAPPADKKTDKPKKAKKTSNTVAIWRALIEAKACKPTDVVKVVVDTNPKRKDAANRFALYKPDMTVEAYQNASKNAGHTLAGALADVRWDLAAGFIKVGNKTADQWLSKKD